MPSQSDVSRHYTHGGLTEAIRAGVAALGKTPDTVTIDDLAPVDEFHVGGRKASGEFVDQLGLTAGMHVLDVGCGLGGAARFVAHRYGSRVSGLDLTSEYVETGNALCRWLGLDQRVALRQGSALEMPYADGLFDAAFMMHVGMNIAEKEKLALEVARVLKPGCIFGIYDVMQTGPDELAYPVPWAATSQASAVSGPDEYKAVLRAAGFDIVAERNRRDFAMAFFAEFRAKTTAAGGPSPLGLHVLMGKNAPDKVANMIDNISKGRIAPIELIARRA